jgi:guanylate kinase
MIRLTEEAIVQIVSISGASGSGKTTLQDDLLKQVDAGRVLSNTTRPRRSTDKEMEYRYLSKEAFLKLSDLLWTQEIHGNLYGTRASDILMQLEMHEMATIIVTVNCHEILRKNFADTPVKTTALHILSPTETELRARLTERGDAEASIEERIMDCQGWDHDAKKLQFLQLIQPNTREGVLRDALSILR